MKNFKTSLLVAAVAGLSLYAGSADAALVSEYGILDLAANGGINPNTGVAWADGDTYRLAFHTSVERDADSPDAAVYNAWVTAQANTSGLGNGSIATSTGWTAMMSTETVNVRVNTNTEPTDGGVAVYAMDGTSAIARDNGDIWDGWSNPFASDPTGLTGNVTVRTGSVHYSPFLDENGNQTVTPDANHGMTVWTGSDGPNTNPTQYVGVESSPGVAGNTQTGNANANTSGRVWRRGNESNLNLNSFYAISDELTVSLVPEPSSFALLGLGGLLIARRRRG